MRPGVFPSATTAFSKEVKSAKTAEKINAAKRWPT
jgi:hypothetical protein